jgi:multidrug efflux pump subunit AcrB
MKISDFSVRNYQFTIVLFAMLAALGISSWLAIPRAEDPTFPAPTYTIVAVYPGATPTDIERLVIDPIEERLGELDELKDVAALIVVGLVCFHV